jgi:DDE superfamily endonuclease
VSERGRVRFSPVRSKKGELKVHTLPTAMIQVLALFAPLFSQRVFQHAKVLLAGAVLAPGRRTVSSALHVMGLDQQWRFHRYHRVLSRACWSSREASRILLGLLVETFVPNGPLVLGIDETLERPEERRSLPRASTEIQCAPATATS